MAESQRFIDRYSTALAEPHCDHCGFKLSGLAERGICPECGSDFEPATTGIPRRFRLARAAGYLALPVAIATIACLVTSIATPRGSDGIAIGMLLLLPAPLAIAWFGWRAGRASMLLFTRCMPRRRAQGGLFVLLFGVCQCIGFSAMFLGLLGAGALIALGLVVARGIDA
ncbi:MAG: hypothetical protein LW806_07470 [Planctomycetaceae bacterium]|nr:hypothetical protein [Planctomycetaceae bacterium]